MNALRACASNCGFDVEWSGSMNRWIGLFDNWLGRWTTLPIEEIGALCFVPDLGKPADSVERTAAGLEAQ
jgi:hypothetical protein